MTFPGKIITIDLSTRNVTTSPIDEATASAFLGGRGLNAWLMRKHIGPDVEPLSPANMLFLSAGLLTGTDFPSSSRLQIAARSPQTGLLGSSNIGGHFGALLTRAGYQAVCLTGKADTPVYLWLDADGVEIRDAAGIWGLEPGKVPAALGLDRNTELVTIGPGGENLVRYASVFTGDGHAAGRTGLGAVMGSKHVKAIVVARYPTPRNGRDSSVAKLARDYALQVRQSERYDLYSTYSNGAYMNWTHDTGLLGTRNFQTVHFDQVDQLDGTQFMRYVTRQKTCHRCPVHCRAEVRFDYGRYAKIIGERPDIEPLMVFGPRIGVDNLEAVMYLHHVANEIGIDVISTGGALAFAMELFELGIITTDDTDGLELTWGNVEAAAEMMHQIGARQGFGNVLAEGVRRAAEIIGRGSEAYAYHSKGLELPGYDPRGAQGTGLSFAVSNRGADYASVYPSQEFFWTPEQAQQVLGTEKAVDPLSPEGKGALVGYASIVSAVLDALGICKVPVLSVLGDFSLQPEAELAAALTGWDLTSERLFEIGRRILSAERRLNITFGMTQQDDSLQPVFLQTPLDAGPAKGRVLALEQMVADYYRAMGWDSEGNPVEDSD